jgi:holo-[acyl-carrier protein] synthase
MILGIGNDIVDIRRIENTLDMFGQRFLHRVFTAGEREKAEKQTAARHKRAGTLAKRFAAKEAFLKALGDHNRSINWQEMDVGNLPSGKPVLKVSGAAKEALNRLVPANMRAQVDLSMTDEFPLAQAIVIISAVKNP